MSKFNVRIGATWGTALAGGVAMMAGAAHAQSYDWTWTPSTKIAFSASGEFVLSGNVITNFTGTWDGTAINELLPTESGLFSSDNFYPIDSGGVSFSLVGGGEVDLASWMNRRRPNWFYNAGSFGYGTFAATPAGVPEPGTWSLLGVGAAGLIAVRRLRRKSPALAAA